MFKRIRIFIFLAFISICHPSWAILNLELTQGIASAIPIAISPFGIHQNDLASIVTSDLKNSGRFKVYEVLTGKTTSADYLLEAKVTNLSTNHYKIDVQLVSQVKNKNPQNKPEIHLIYQITPQQLRATAHQISDRVYEYLTGVPGVFSTKVAYIVVKSLGSSQYQYRLEVADQDGFNPRSLLTSSEPIMSPAWSPNGKQLAYVSFEGKRTSIYVQTLTNGARTKIAAFPGINGAPAWSPDGNKLAFVLSKSGTPNLYTLDLLTKKLTQLTNDWFINTEPAWAPNGKSIIFTSNRSGGPQIYQFDLITKKISRLTYEGSYNARASFTPDGNHLVVLNQTDRLFNIGILDLDTGNFKLLTNATGTDNESPSVAPNGSMILYGTLHQGKSILGMVANDASIQIRLPTREGDVQDPAWSPFLNKGTKEKV